jgi:N,N'-diacetyllegionaminate synthase
MTNNVLIIAEVGSVHDGSFGNAGKLIDLAGELGAGCIKFQTHIAAAETTRNAPMPPYFKGEPRYEYFERTGFRLEQWKMLKGRADERGLEFLSSPFSAEAVELLEDVGVTRYKIPSGEVTNIPMLEVVAETGKPVLLSSGMSDWREMDRAVETILKRHDRLIPMQCTSSYPTPNDRVGLNVLLEMKERWGLPVGYSDHTLDNHACFAAVALGAVVVEKHLTFSRAMYGSDAPHSAEPLQFADLATGVRAIGEMLAAKVVKDDLTRYASMKEIFEKSVVARADIPAGVTLDASMLAVKKPGTGIPAARLNDVIGRRTRRALAADALLSEQDFE